MAFHKRNNRTHRDNFIVQHATRCECINTLHAYKLDQLIRKHCHCSAVLLFTSSFANFLESPICCFITDLKVRGAF